jgi:hypothetical protein
MFFMPWAFPMGRVHTTHGTKIRALTADKTGSLTRCKTRRGVEGQARGWFSVLPEVWKRPVARKACLPGVQRNAELERPKRARVDSFAGAAPLQAPSPREVLELPGGISRREDRVPVMRRYFSKAFLLLPSS